MVSVRVKLKVRLHGAVARDVMVWISVLVAVAPPTVTVVEPPDNVTVEVTPPSVTVVV